ncbi:MAG: sugar phosphate nucleotidyltransferase [Thermovenabulum sp.]|uniref:sugar phosphate nucleotidyltransferase n=1 Tax=Thermovenabulum sp. TaxID=3100335 RepID=UPI003C79A338
MIGIVLCSGYGKKIWPYSDWWQKCCIPIGNKPNIIRIIEQLKKINLRKIIVVTSYYSQMVKYCLKNIKGINIFEEEKPEGTAKSLYKAVKNLNDDFLVIYGDTFVDDSSILKIYNQFLKEKLPSVLTKHLKDNERSIDHICAYVNNGEVRAIYGHPRSNYVNYKLANVFIINKELKKYLEINPGFMKNVCVGGMPPKESFLEQSIQMMIEDNKKVLACEVEGFLVDIDKPWHIMEANKIAIDEIFDRIDDSILNSKTSIDPSAVISGKIYLGEKSKIGKNVIIKGDVWIGNNTLIDNGAIIEGKVVIGNNSRITDYCKIGPYSTIGNNNRIGFNAEFCGITFDGVSIIHNSEMYGIIGSYTDIAAGCLTGSLRFDDLQTIHKINGRNELPNTYSNAVFIGDHTRTGVGNIFLPGVKVGINCAIGPGAIIEEDIPSNSLIIVKQEKVIKRWGPEKYGW